MDYDNPAVGGGGWGGDDQSDFTDSERSGKEKKEKILLGSSKKKDKEKKKEKEKETKYNQLGAESSGDDDEVKGSGKSKKKAFKIGLAKKDKKDKKDKENKDSESKEKEKDKEGKKKEKKDKPKLKLKKSHKTDSDTDKTGSQPADINSFPPIFGVALETAVERNKCHDGVNLPVVVRECVDYIESEGLTVEGIYRSSGVKSKITKLKAAYNSRQVVKLGNYEPAVVASLFKLFLRELPEPVLTNQLGHKFEEVSQMKIYTDRRDGLLRLLQELPECNRVLIQWVFVHMGHVIANEKMNKMTLQNVSIVLSPTMRISHRVLNCIFEHHAALFSNVKLLRYIPPISDPRAQLPDSPRAIELEMKKQESLLAELHAEMSSGVVVGRAREEQLWEQQRIVTQLKRNLRHAKSVKAVQEQDYEEELNFSLQTPAVPASSIPAVAQSSTADVPKQQPASKAVVQPQQGDTAATQQQQLGTAADGFQGEKEAHDSVNESSPEDGGEHRVTVQIHQDQESQGSKEISAANQVTPALTAGHVTVIQCNQINSTKPIVPTTSISDKPSVTVTSTAAPKALDATSSVTTVKPVTSTAGVPTVAPTKSPPSVAPQLSSGSAPVREQVEKSPPICDQVDSNQSEIMEQGLEMTQSSPNSTQQFASQVVSFSSPIMSAKVIKGEGTGHPLSKIPLLPPPPPSNKPKVSHRAPARPPAPTSSLLPPENKLKSKSLPRGLPSDGTAFESEKNLDKNDKLEDNNNEEKEDSKEKERNQKHEALILEEMRLKFEYEELMTMKSELERKKRTERREITELQEEIATMQTLYQYRTYSVDSSEEDSDNGALGDTKEQRAEKLKLLAKLAKEKQALEEKKWALQGKLADERAACLRLRVNIRMEQERIRRNKLSQFPGIGFGKPNLMD